MKLNFSSRTTALWGFIGTCCLTSVLAMPSQALEADARVKKALDAAKIHYDINTDKEYEVVFDFTDLKRSQLVFITSSTSPFGGSNWRDVYSYAFSVKGKLSAQQANMLLIDSDSHVFGAWATSFANGKTHVFYQVAVRADAPAKELLNALNLVSSAADEMEHKITKKDDN